MHPYTLNNFTDIVDSREKLNQDSTQKGTLSRNESISITCTSCKPNLSSCNKQLFLLHSVRTTSRDQLLNLCTHHSTRDLSHRRADCCLVFLQYFNILLLSKDQGILSIKCISTLTVTLFLIQISLANTSTSHKMSALTAH